MSDLGNAEPCPLHLNIYHVMVPDTVFLQTYDVYTEFVVCCSTEEEARRIHPRDGNYEWWKVKGEDSDWIDSKDVDKLVVTREGYTENVERRVLCASFRSG